MQDTKVVFTESANGYDKGQVDRYIEKLSDAYQSVYDEYQDLSVRHEELLDKVNSDDSNKPDTQGQTLSDSDMDEKGLANVEEMVQTITEEAKAEAAAIISEAQRIKGEVDAATEKARVSAQRMLKAAINETDKAKETAKVIIDGANIEAETAKETAKNIILAANAEARSIVVMARKSLVRTHKLTLQAARETKKMLESHLEKASKQTLGFVDASKQAQGSLDAAKQDLGVANDSKQDLGQVDTAILAHDLVDTAVQAHDLVDTAILAHDLLDAVSA